MLFALPIHQTLLRKLFNSLQFVDSSIDNIQEALVTLLLRASSGRYNERYIDASNILFPMYLSMLNTKYEIQAFQAFTNMIRTYPDLCGIANDEMVLLKALEGLHSPHIRLSYAAIFFLKELTISPVFPIELLVPHINVIISCMYAPDSDIADCALDTCTNLLDAALEQIVSTNFIEFFGNFSLDGKHRAARFLFQVVLRMQPNDYPNILPQLLLQELLNMVELEDDITNIALSRVFFLIFTNSAPDWFQQGVAIELVSSGAIPIFETLQSSDHLTEEDKDMIQSLAQHHQEILSTLDNDA